MNARLPVKDLFDLMAEEYDVLSDLWYSWLFARIHGFIADFLEKESGSQPSSAVDVLDVGCGTGLQTFLYRDCGFRVTAFAISPQLVNVARRKEQEGPVPQDAQAPVKIIHRLSQETFAKIQRICGSKPFLPVRWEVADAITYPYPEKHFDLVNCCGSVLNF